ncbi:hypothetical protein B0J14DRAFT_98225 [Halenospora varia]|nr:hypothetical protein B0J14DRAFT_98225 [Halenospora varia]
MEFEGLKLTQYPKDWDVGRQMFGILESLLQPSSSTSSEVAAHMIHNLYLNNLVDLVKSTVIHNFDRELWDLVFNISSKVPYNHPFQERLASFVAHLKRNPRWRELPNIGLSGFEFISDLEEFDDLFGATNFYSFVARLTRDGTRSFPVWATWCFRNTLESGLHLPGPKLDQHTLIAANWIEFAGETLFREEKTFSEGSEGLLWKKFQYEDLRRERWHFCGARFRSIGNANETSEDSRLIAIKAAETMKRIEEKNLGQM